MVGILDALRGGAGQVGQGLLSAGQNAFSNVSSPERFAGLLEDPRVITGASILQGGGILGGVQLQNQLAQQRRDRDLQEAALRRQQEQDALVQQQQQFANQLAERRFGLDEQRLALAQRDLEQERELAMLGAASKGDDFNNEQRKIAGFAARMKRAADTMTALSERITPGRISLALDNSLARASLSAEEQEFLRAADEFANANLRRETGAQVTAEERISAFRRFIPLFGDKPETVKVKLQAQRETVGDFVTESAGAAEKLFPDLFAVPQASGAEDDLIEIERAPDGSFRRKRK